MFWLVGISFDNPALDALKVAVWQRRVLGNHSSDPGTMSNPDCALFYKQMSFDRLYEEAGNMISSWEKNNHLVIDSPVQLSVAALLGFDHASIVS